VSDPLLQEAIKIIQQRETATISHLQRKLRIGYNRSFAIIEQMEELGVIMPIDENGMRKVNFDKIVDVVEELEEKEPQSITKEQWEKIESELTGYMGRVKFKLQGFEVLLSLEMSKQKIVPVVYIDGQIKGSWCSNENEKPEILEQVWCAKHRAYYSAKRIKNIEKAWGKRAAKKTFPQLHERATFYIPYFSKGSVVVRQYKKIEGLELVQIGCGND